MSFLTEVCSNGPGSMAEARPCRDLAHAAKVSHVRKHAGARGLPGEGTGLQEAREFYAELTASVPKGLRRVTRAILDGPDEATSAAPVMVFLKTRRGRRASGRAGGHQWPRNSPAILVPGTCVPKWPRCSAWAMLDVLRPQGSGPVMACPSTTGPRASGQKRGHADDRKTRLLYSHWAILFL